MNDSTLKIGEEDELVEWRLGCSVGCPAVETAFADRGVSWESCVAAAYQSSSSAGNVGTL